MRDVDLIISKKLWNKKFSTYLIINNELRRLSKLTKEII